jgi:threonine dehydrogenase-like Zn-dependent dehydrogenase
MRAVCWHGTGDVRIDTVPDPEIQDPGDVIVKVTSTAICGSDLHIYDGYIPSMEQGDVLGHEFMGEVLEVGRGVSRLKKGDRVVVPFPIACGHCFFCEHDLWSLCDNSNPNKSMLDEMYGHGGAALFGYSHLYGGFDGGQAEYVRVPYADVGPLKVPEGLSDEQVLFLSDIFPTGYAAVDEAGVMPGDTVAVWGCGPVGQFAIQSAWLLGAGQVIAIDRLPERLEMARSAGRAEVIDASEERVMDRLNELTGNRGPDLCVDAVGLEAHGVGTVDAVVDRVKQAVMLGTDRPHVLREVIQACRKGGRVAVAGVYAGVVDKFPFGAAFGKGLTLTMGQTHVQKYLKPLLERIERGEIDPTFVITHRLPLEQAPEAYKTFRDKDDGCMKVVLKP